MRKRIDFDSWGVQGTVNMPTCAYVNEKNPSTSTKMRAVVDAILRKSQCNAVVCQTDGTQYEAGKPVACHYHVTIGLQYRRLRHSEGMTPTGELWISIPV